jgi:hypothetical protein
MAKQQSKNTGKWGRGICPATPMLTRSYVAAGVPFPERKRMPRNYAATRGEKVEVVSANAKAEAAETTAETTTVTHSRSYCRARNKEA